MVLLHSVYQLQLPPVRAEGLLSFCSSFCRPGAGENLSSFPVKYQPDVEQFQFSILCDYGFKEMMWLKATAIRLEAIALSRLEAIAIRYKDEKHKCII